MHSNLPFNITAEEMYDIFGKYGAIRQIRLCVPLRAACAVLRGVLNVREPAAVAVSACCACIVPSQLRPLTACCLSRARLRACCKP